MLENDSITNAAHQIGFFETVAGPGVLAELPGRIAAVTPPTTSPGSRPAASCPATGPSACSGPHDAQRIRPRPGARAARRRPDPARAGDPDAARGSPSAAAVSAGSAADPPGGEGTACLLSRLLDRGAGGRSAGEIADLLDLRGVSPCRRGHPAHHHRGLRLLSPRTSTRSSGSVCDMVRAPACPDDEVRLRRGQLVTGLRQDEDRPATRAVEAAMALLYGDAHPYGRRPRGSVDTVAGIEAGPLRDFHAAHFVPPRTTVGAGRRHRGVRGRGRGRPGGGRLDGAAGPAPSPSSLLRRRPPGAGGSSRCPPRRRRTSRTASPRSPGSIPRSTPTASGTWCSASTASAAGSAAASASGRAWPTTPGARSRPVPSPVRCWCARGSPPPTSTGPSRRSTTRWTASPGTA